MRRRPTTSRVGGFAWLLAALSAPLLASEPFVIQVVDGATGRGVPLVELATTNNVLFYTDSNGIVAFDEPGWLDANVYFAVRSHGYELPAGPFGFQGRVLRVTPGGRARLELRRINIAERLYRVTGAGIYRDSRLAGEPVPIRKPLLNASVTGSDSVNTVVFRNKVYWFWGDTNWPRHPLGNFHVPGATSELPGQGGLAPSVGVDLEYFVGKDGFAKPTAQIEGDGATWISGVVVLKDEKSGAERMFAHYAKVRQPMQLYDRGLVEFDPAENRFRKVAAFPREAPFPHGGHAFLHRADGKLYVYYADPFPVLRVPATPEALARQEAYEAYTCLKAGTRLADGEFDRGADGRLRFAWRADTEQLSPIEEAKRRRAGELAPETRFLTLRDIETGKDVVAHRGSVYWNEFRRRWVMITGEFFGMSLLGETWYAEADRPLGPWAYARKIVTHDKYSFYNPKQHPMFDEDGGRTIYFEGTYANTFSGNEVKTPRYDYNQILYRLDLEDPRLNLPVAVFRGSAPEKPFVVGARDEGRAPAVAFFALERPTSGSIAVYVGKDAAGALALRVDSRSGEDATGDRPPLFYALAPDAASPPPDTAALFRFISPDGLRAEYSIEEAPHTLEGFRREPQPVARVWRHPCAAMPPPPD